MLPDFLRGTYQCYKKDTDTIADWLATTAKKCGYRPESLQSNENIPPAGHISRLKGKARKLAKDSAAKPPEQVEEKVNASSSSVYTISVKAFTVLASQIASYRKAPVKVPAAIFDALERAISFRKEHNTWFENEEDQLPVASAANGRHAYFITVLERVRDTLRPLMSLKPSSAPSITPAKPSKSKGAGGSNFSNVFNTLEPDESSGESSNEAHTASSQETGDESVESPHYQAEIPKAFREQSLAAICLIFDVKKIREHIKKLWASYREGLTDLIAASITTNTAVEIVRDMQKNFFKAFPDAPSCYSIVDSYYCEGCAMHDEDPKNIAPGDSFNMAMYHIAEEVSLPIWINLQKLKVQIVPGTVPYFHDLGERDDSTEWLSKSPRDRVRDDRNVLFEACTGLTALALLDPLADDELIRGISGLASGDEVSLWLVFAAQSFLDVQHEIGSDVSRPFTELQKRAKYIEASIKQNSSFHQNLANPPSWSADMDSLLTKHIPERIEKYVIRDFVKDAVYGPDGVTPPYRPNEPHRFFKQYPVLCGIWLYTLRYMTQKTSIAFANKWNCIVPYTHMWNAALHEGFISIQWKDMQAILLLQRDAKIFVGDRPKQPVDYIKKWDLFQGASITSMAKNSRSKYVKSQGKGPRGLVNSFGFSELFSDRYLGKMPTGCTDFVAADKKIKDL